MNYYFDINSILIDLHEQQRIILANCFQELFEKKVLQIEQGELTLIQRNDTNKIELHNPIKFVVNTDGYTKKLEEENRELKKLLVNLRMSISNYDSFMEG
jgi:hypothetical protein